MTPLPRVIALLAVWNESPAWLAATITSAAPHVDHFVICDGRYALYTADEGVFSRQDQIAAAVETCQAAGLGLTLHRPSTVWFGNEVEKRNRMFRLAELEAEPDDWYMVIDADILIDRAPHDLRQQLADSDLDVAEVSVWERGDPYRNPARLEFESKTAMPADSHYTLRFLFRAIPGLEVTGAHYCYRTPDGRFLWGAPCEDDPPYDRNNEPALDLTGLFRIEHRTNHRPLQRHLDAQDYYRRRDAAGVEVRPA